MKYNLYNKHNLLTWDKLRELPETIRYGDEIAPNLDSSPDLSVLNHALDKRHEINLDPPDLGDSPTEGDLRMLVFCLSFSLRF
jgi:hypothetical protein